MILCTIMMVRETKTTSNGHIRFKKKNLLNSLYCRYSFILFDFQNILPKLCDRRNGFHVRPTDKLLRRLFDDLLLNFNFDDAVPVGLGVPDDTPDELPIDRADIEPLHETNDEMIGYNLRYQPQLFFCVSLNEKKKKTDSSQYL